jgi:hypothetical protein
MSTEWTGDKQLNCEECKKLMKQVAPTEESCKTKTELRLETRVQNSEISGGRLKECLEELEREGTVKHVSKCVKCVPCYYDPASPRENAERLRNLMAVAENFDPLRDWMEGTEQTQRIWEKKVGLLPLPKFVT